MPQKQEKKQNRQPEMVPADEKYPKNPNEKGKIKKLLGYFFE